MTTHITITWIGWPGTRFSKHTFIKPKKIKKFKARLVARGDLQQWETYNQTYADTIDSKSINMIFAIAAQEDLHLASIDIKTAFLYSPMTETVFLRRPKGVSDDMMPEYVHLKKMSLWP